MAADRDVAGAEAAESAEDAGGAASENGSSATGQGTSPEGARPAQKPEPEGFNRIPYWMHHEKGLSDFVAGVLVTLAGGIIIMVVCYILILVWPAK